MQFMIFNDIAMIFIVLYSTKQIEHIFLSSVAFLCVVLLHVCLSVCLSVY